MYLDKQRDSPVHKACIQVFPSGQSRIKRQAAQAWARRLPAGQAAGMYPAAPRQSDCIKGTSGNPKGLYSGSGSAGTAMTSRRGTIQFPVPQGQRGMLWAWPGQFCCCRHLPAGIMVLICRKRPGYFYRNEILKLEKCLLNICPDAVFTAVLSVAADKLRFHVDLETVAV